MTNDEREQELRRQVSEGTKAERDLTLLAPRLDSIRQKIYRELETPIFLEGHLVNLHARLVVCSELENELKALISSGKIAQKELEEK